MKMVLIERFFGALIFSYISSEINRGRSTSPSPQNMFSKKSSLFVFFKMGQRYTHLTFTYMEKEEVNN